MLLDVDSEYHVHIMGYVPHVGFVTSSRATMMINFVCCKKKKMGRHANSFSKKKKM
jgi:hypothetical protein